MVIPLEINRPGLAFITVDSAACDALNLLIVNSGDIVQDNRDGAAYQSYVISVPDIRWNWSFDRKFEKTVDRTDGSGHIRARRCRSVGRTASRYLRLISSAQVNAAVFSRRDIKFDMKFEIVKRTLCAEIGTPSFVH
jgi:hypothetical protein